MNSVYAIPINAVHSLRVCIIALRMYDAENMEKEKERDRLKCRKTVS